MNTIERIKEECKKRGVSIARLERDCGFSNGYIRNLREGTMPGERLLAVADYLGVPYRYLITGEDESWYLNPETARIAQEVFDDPDTRMLFDAAREARPEDIRLAAEMLKRFKETNPDG